MNIFMVRIARCFVRLAGIAVPAVLLVLGSSAACAQSAGAEASEDPCRQEAFCALRGKCTQIRDGICAATTDADCAASDACRDYGECVAREGLCRAYEEGDAIPRGHHLEAQPYTVVAVAGGAIFSGVYGLTSLNVMIWDPPVGGGTYRHALIPVVGPFIAMETSGVDVGGQALLALDGVAQVASLGMLIAGACAERMVLMPDVPEGSAGPRVRVGLGSIALEWR